VRHGKAMKGSAPKRRGVLTVWAWVPEVLAEWIEEIRPLLHETWFLDLDVEQRLRRLTARHEAYGRSPAQARTWAHGTDEVNAAVVADTAHRADLVVRLAAPPPA